jgi:hypothetical protein
MLIPRRMPNQLPNQLSNQQREGYQRMTGRVPNQML